MFSAGQLVGNWSHFLFVKQGVNLLSYSHGDYERDQLFYVYPRVPRAFLAELSVGFTYLHWLIIYWFGFLSNNNCLSN